MPFTPPQFNCLANLWRDPDEPPDPPTRTDVACQLYFTPKGQFDVDPNDFDLYNPPVYVRFPVGYDVQVEDVLEIDQGEGWFYTVRWVERVHKNFPNEYRVAICQQGIGIPIPPPSGAGILMEDSGYVMMEDGSYVLME